MNRGPPRVELGIASCQSCGDPTLKVSTTKHGFPAAYCKACDTQFQPRAEKGSLLLLGRIHTWTNPDAAKVMLADADRAGLAAAQASTPPKLPPHLSPATSPAPAKPKRRSFLDEEL